MKHTGILIVALLALVAGSAHAAFPGRNGAIIYGYDGYSYNEDDYSSRIERGIYVERGWHKRRLVGCSEVTRTSEQSSCDRQTYSDPAVSPDGALVAFDAGASLAVVGIDGAGVRMLPGRSGDDGQPAFSPTGTRIVFTDARTGLWIVDLNDGTTSRLVPGGSSPAWSTRDWIAFVRDGAIYRVRPDGSHMRRVARQGAAPTWSPDGRRLAFTRSMHHRHGKLVQLGGIFVMDADGSHLTRLPRQARDELGSFDLTWSPDGRRLLVFDGSAYTVDLSGRMRHDFGLEDYDGAESVDSIYGIDWRPLPACCGKPACAARTSADSRAMRWK